MCGEVVSGCSGWVGEQEMGVGAVGGWAGHGGVAGGGGSALR